MKYYSFFKKEINLLFVVMISLFIINVILFQRGVDRIYIGLRFPLNPLDHFFDDNFFAVSSLMRQRFVTPYNLFTNRNRSYSYLSMIIGAFLVIKISLMQWKKLILDKESYFQTNRLSAFYFSSIKVFMFNLFLYMVSLAFTFWVLFLKMKVAIPLEQFFNLEPIEFRLFYNLTFYNITSWLLAITLIYGIMVVSLVLKVNKKSTGTISKFRMAIAIVILWSVLYFPRFTNYNFEYLICLVVLNVICYLFLWKMLKRLKDIIQQKTSNFY